MKPLTDHTPKPLLPVQGKPLMRWTLDALMAAGVQDLVLNTAWLGEQVEAVFGDRLGAAHLHYSHEGRDFGGALETLGGICRALPALSPDGQTPFWVAAGDVYCPGFAFERSAVKAFAASEFLAHLWLVPNPPHNPKGDFALLPDGRLSNAPDNRLTFSTLALYKPALFAAPLCPIPLGNPQGIKAPLGPFLRQAIDLGWVSATRYNGPWTDVGTPERLAELNQKPAQ
jgi:MurNAc alpha-1-phosphate uridylyltransferase